MRQFKITGSSWSGWWWHADTEDWYLLPASLTQYLTGKYWDCSSATAPITADYIFIKNQETIFFIWNLFSTELFPSIWFLPSRTVSLTSVLCSRGRVVGVVQHGAIQPLHGHLVLHSLQQPVRIHWEWGLALPAGGLPSSASWNIWNISRPQPGFSLKLAYFYPQPGQSLHTFLYRGGLCHSLWLLAWWCRLLSLRDILSCRIRWGWAPCRTSPWCRLLLARSRLSNTRDRVQLAIQYCCNNLSQSALNIINPAQVYKVTYQCCLQSFGFSGGFSSFFPPPSHRHCSAALRFQL